MDHAVRDLVGYAFDRAIEILNVHRPLHEKTAQLLLQKETLEEEDIAALRAQIVPRKRPRRRLTSSRSRPPIGRRTALTQRDLIRATAREISMRNLSGC